jgi:hypothetical protein
MVKASSETESIIAAEFMLNGSVDLVFQELTPHQRVMAMLSAALGLKFMHPKGIATMNWSLNINRSLWSLYRPAPCSRGLDSVIAPAHSRRR